MVEVDLVDVEVLVVPEEVRRKEEVEEVEVDEFTPLTTTSFSLECSMG